MLAAPIVGLRAGQSSADEMLVRAALDRGAYADAERLATAWHDATVAGGDAESPDSLLAADWLIEARQKNGRAKRVELLRLAEATVRARERRAPSGDADLVRSLINLSAVRTDRGDYVGALAAAERAGRLAAVVGARTSLVADSLDAQARALIQVDRLRDASAVLDRARGIRATDQSSSALQRAGTLYLMALLQRQDGKYAVATSVVTEALGISRTVAPDHPLVAQEEQLLGDLRFLSGDVLGAREEWQTALARAERSLRADHPMLERILRPLALGATALGDLAEARTLRERARVVADAEIAECDPETPGLLNDSASAADYEGDYPRAQRLYDRAFTVRTRCLGAVHSLVAGILHNQAFLAMDMGDLRESQRLHRKALDMWKATLGPTHSYVARALDALAEVAMARQDLASAESLYQQALANRRSSLGGAHPDIAWTLASLAQVAIDRGDFDGARRHLAEADNIYKSGVASQAPDQRARVVLMTGSLELRQRNFEGARALFVEGLRMREGIFGADHPLSAATRALLASAEFGLGDTSVAVADALGAERIGREHLQATTRYLPERQALFYAAHRPHGLDLALSTVAAGHANDLTPIADAVIRSRGVVLDELAARAHDQAATSSTRSALAATLLNARQRYANLTLRSLNSSDATLLKLLDDTRREKEDAERALAEQDRQNSATLNDVGIRDLQLALPERSAIVAFSRYERTSDASKPTRPSYIAFVIKPGEQPIQAFSLGSAQTVDDLINVWRVQARQPAAEQAYREIALRLRRRIWDPLAPALSEVSRVFVVPDGAINFVAFAALPSGTSKYLLETGPQFHYLTAERDLLRPASASANTGLLAVGGAMFDDVATVRAAASLRAGCASSGALRFVDLPGTRDEVQEVAQIWRTSVGGTTILSGSRATKRATTAALAHRRVVHLATHGFFLNSDCQPSLPLATRAVGGLTSSSARPHVVDASPLVLSGLALAGANNAAKRPAADDGILTAEEVASLDLSGTEWAVLSACDTGLGEVAVGEGVVGLRRAFHIAGARTVIMSLWSVEDQSARLWMRELYSARFTRGLTTADAMRTAALRVLAARRSRGESAHPFYWAGFVAVGDWR